MKVTSTYGIGIKGPAPFGPTVMLWRAAVDWFARVAVAEWAALSALGTSQKRLTATERLTHPTADNPATKHRYDAARPEFLKFPAYLRRSAINEAIGTVSSCMSNLANWEAAPKQSRGRRPSLGHCHACPTLYGSNTFRRLDLSVLTAEIKYYDVQRRDWLWLKVGLDAQDIRYVKTRKAGSKMLAPTLQKRGKVWSLDFPFEDEAKLSDVPLGGQKVLAVDLGVNSACACCLMSAGGTVSERAFLALPEEEDRLNDRLKHTRYERSHGHRHSPKLWAAIKGLNRRMSVETARFIVEKATEWDADVIVMEHLDLQGKKKGSKRQRLHHWRARLTQAMVEHKAHLAGIRISRVCARNTSRLAFDGSGPVVRGKELPDEVKAKHGASYSLCRFSTGKLYNADLNASYNIGARYFIRETLKSLPATAGQGAWVNIPGFPGGTTRTLSDLISLRAAAPPEMAVAC